MSSSQNLKDLEYFFENWNKEYIPHTDLDIWKLVASKLPIPTGYGGYDCHPDAMERLQLMTERIHRQSNLSEQISFNTLFDKLKQLFVKRFIIENRNLNESEADKLASHSVKAVKKAFKTIEFHHPCHIDLVKEPSFFNLGPVKFYPIDRYKKLYEKDHVEFIEQGRHERTITDRREYLKIFRNDLNRFSWVAIVEINDCDEETARIKAKNIIKAAFDMLHVLMSSKLSKLLSTNIIGVPPLTYSYFTIDESGLVDVSIYKPEALQNFDDDWWTQLNSEGFEEFIKLTGIMLENELSNSLTPPQTRRLLDAASWYAQASIDENNGAKIVKYITALERLTTTSLDKNENDEIAKRVTSRSAAILSIFGADYNESKTTLKKLYTRRSEYLHGSKSPVDSSFENLIDSAEESTRAVIFGYLKKSEHLLGETKWTDKKIDTDWNTLTAQFE